MIIAAYRFYYQSNSAILLIIITKKRHFIEMGNLFKNKFIEWLDKVIKFDINLYLFLGNHHHLCLFCIRKKRYNKN